MKREVPWAALAGIGVATLLAVIFSGGDLIAAAAPVVTVALLYAEWRAPLRVSALGLFFLSLIADAPQDNPMGGYWHSPLYALGELLCSNWSNAFGISVLPFTGIQLLCALLLLRIVIRRLSGNAPAGPRTAPVLQHSMAIFLVAMVALALLGAARSGQMGTAYWQVRQFVCIPFFAFVLAEALEGPRDHLLLAPLVLAAALIKTAVGMYFYLAIALPQGLNPPCITSHADTLLYCLALTLVGLRWVEHPDWPALRRMLWYAPLVMAAVWFNNRRIAYVGLAAVFITVWLLTPWSSAKRTVARLGLLALPLLAVVVAIDWRSPDPFLKPVASIRTMIVARDAARSAADASTLSRDIENFNLAQTLRMHPLGTGLGHGYEEVVKGPDISEDFALYRYIPHNSVLWMLTMAGPVGFFLLWSMFWVGIYLAARALRLARTPDDRVAALAAICAQLLFLIQAFGDMGTQNWSTTWLVAAALAVAGRLAVSTGAWPAPATQPAFTLEPAWNLNR